ncbi:hypothetical protein CR513_55849, partial [Mucuna pruriens]
MQNVDQFKRLPNKQCPYKRYPPEALPILLSGCGAQVAHIPSRWSHYRLGMSAYKRILGRSLEEIPRDASQVPPNDFPRRQLI